MFKFLFALLVLSVLVLPHTADAGGKVGIYGVRMEPDGEDAQNFSKPGWGGGIHLVAPFPQLANFFAGTGGFEVINLMSRDRVFIDGTTGLRTEQQTSQNYYRLFLGGQIGGHGRGFIRPHIGSNIALVIYSINTDVVIPNDADPDNEIRQDYATVTKSVFGWDITAGVDLNFANAWSIDLGVRYLKSFSLPQQLGEGSETVHPQYFQYYIGIGVSFKTISRWGS